MASEQLKIARIQKQIANQLITRDLLISIIQNPLVTLLGGSWGLLALQDKYGSDTPFFRGIEQGVALTAVGGVAAAQALGPVLPDLVKAGSDTVNNLIGSLPLLKGGR